MKNWEGLQEQLWSLGETLIASATQEVQAPDLGLDRRAAWKPLYVGADWIACHASDLGSLSYYGGFEYVDKECVQACGDYVFFSTEDSRVREHREQAE